MNIKILLCVLMLFFLSGKERYTIKKTNLSGDLSDYYAPTKFGNGIFFNGRLDEKNKWHYSVDRLPQFAKVYFSEIENKEKLSEPKLIEIDFPTSFGGVYLSDFSALTGEVFLSTNNKKPVDGILNLCIYKGKMERGKITRFKKLDFYDASISYTHATISKTGLKLVFVMSENEQSKLMESNRKSILSEWEKPYELEVLNDGDLNIFPKFLSDSLLVFSSDAAGGLGGLDIYKSEWINDNWTFPENWKEMNSELDDFGIEMIGENWGYFSRKNEWGKDEILYFEIEE